MLASPAIFPFSVLFLALVEELGVDFYPARSFPRPELGVGSCGFRSTRIRSGFEGAVVVLLYAFDHVADFSRYRLVTVGLPRVLLGLGICAQSACYEESDD